MSVKDSKFYINIKNELGLEYKKVRGDLLALSLSKPSNYYDLRTSIISSITERLVEDQYNLFWNVLRYGRIKDGERSFVYTDAKGAPIDYIPNLPEHLINNFCTKVARTVEDFCEEAVSMILPEDYLKLSQNRQKDILSSKGMLEDN